MPDHIEEQSGSQPATPDPSDRIDSATAQRVLPIMRELLNQQKEILCRLDEHERRIRVVESGIGPDAVL